MRYLHRDYWQIKQYLLQQIKQYYPNTYGDFTPHSTGMMFVDLLSSVGDMLSYYTDYSFNQSFIQTTSQLKNIYKFCNYYNYKPIISAPSTTQLTLSIMTSIDTPAIYLPIIKYGMVAISDNGVQYIVQQQINFANAKSQNTSDQNNTVYTKTVSCRSYSIREIEINLNNVNVVDNLIRIPIEDNGFVQVSEVKDNNNDIWYQVDTFQQQKVFLQNPTTKRGIWTDVNYKFKTQINRDGFYQIVILQDKNTPKTLNIKYYRSEGLRSNQSSNSINTIKKIQWQIISDEINNDGIKQSLEITNKIASTGGGYRQSIQQIRYKLKSKIKTQNSINTNNDYNAIIYSMPRRFGVVSKAYTVSHKKNIINSYVVGYGKNKNSVQLLSERHKNNIKEYLSIYSTPGVSIKITDPIILPIKIQFSISTSNMRSGNVILKQCIQKIYDYFKIQNIDIYKGINYNKLKSTILQIDDVINIKSLDLELVNEETYSYSLMQYITEGFIPQTSQVSIFVLDNIQNIKGKIEN